MKILYVTNLINSGGVANVVMTLAKGCIQFDRSIQIDIVCYEKPNDKTLEVLARYSIRTYVIKRVTDNIFNYFRTLDHIMKENHYDAIHTHLEYFNWIPCKIAKNNGIPVRVGHAHGQKSRSESFTFKLIEKVGRILNRKYCTIRFACSDPSGMFVFGKNYSFLPNYVDLEQLTAINDNTENYYDEFGIEKNTLVIGYMGYLGYEKNPEFVITIAKQYININPNVTFIIAGDGVQRSQLEASIETQKNGTKIKLVGYRSDNIGLMRFFDILVVPSYTEGMSLAILEAQLCGTPCVVSKGVPMTNDIQLGLVDRVEDYNVDHWITAIEKMKDKKDSQEMENRVQHLKSINYDKDSVIRKLVLTYKDSE